MKQGRFSNEQIDRILLETDCIDPVNFCSGVIFEENTDEHEDGRRRQTLDVQAQSGLGHGNHAGQDHRGRGQPVI